MVTYHIKSVGAAVRTVYYSMANATSGFYSKDLQVETRFSGKGKATVMFLVSGRVEGKLFSRRFKHCDKAIEFCNSLIHA